MKLRNFGFATIILVLIGLGFSSCERMDREYRQASTFFMEFDALVDSRTGYFEETRRVRVSDDFFTNFNPRRDEIRDIVFYRGWLEITDTFKDLRISEFHIAINGKRVYSTPRGLSSGPNDLIIWEEGYLDDVLDDILYNIRGNRTIDVTVYGYSNLKSEGPIYIDLLADVELLIRD